MIKAYKMHKLFILTALLSLYACKTNHDPSLDKIVIRLEDEPESLNPMLGLSSASREVYEYIFLSLCDFEPSNTELVPVLLKELPKVIIRENGDIAYEMEILPDAVWQDGKDITANDFVFTLKMAYNPRITSASWKQILSDIKDVEIDSQNLKKFSVLTSGEYFLNYEAIVTLELFPQHIYDRDRVLSKYDLASLGNQTVLDSLLVSDSSFVALGERFSSVEYGKNIVSGSGPYALKAWESGQFLILEKIENYWGEKYPNRVSLNAFPKQIIFQIVKDPNTALTLLKNDEIDYMDMTKIPYIAYNELKSDSIYSKKLEFHNPALYRYYYISLNNEDIRLRDKNVRQALCSIIDVDRLIAQVEGGYGQRILSVIHPKKPGTNLSLVPIQVDKQKAIKLLEDSNWKDSDKDGVRDKLIDGKKVSLSLRFFITGSDLSQSISAIFKESAKEIGVNIEVITKDFQATRVENLSTGDFEISTAAISPTEVRDDPFNSWHSSSIGKGGQNFSRYNNPEADSLMETIRSTKNETERSSAYLRLQEVMYYDYPVIFLYSPTLRIALDAEFIPIITTKRPGYLANAFKLES